MLDELHTYRGRQGADVGSGIRARIEVGLQDVPRAVRESLPIPGSGTNLTARFELPVQPGEVYLHRSGSSRNRTAGFLAGQHE